VTKIVAAQYATVLLATDTHIATYIATYIATGTDTDTAKAAHEALIAIPDKKRRRRLPVLNALADVDRLVTARREIRTPSSCRL
jgi:hypothetical protein